MGKLQINVLGTSFQIQARAEEEYLEKLLSYYKEITEAIQKGGSLTSPLQISILAGITLVDELYKQKQKNAAFKESVSDDSESSIEAERITAELIDKITRVLDE